MFPTGTLLMLMPLVSIVLIISFVGGHVFLWRRAEKAFTTLQHLVRQAHAQLPHLAEEQIRLAGQDVFDARDAADRAIHPKLDFLLGPAIPARAQQQIDQLWAEHHDTLATLSRASGRPLTLA